ncbi:MAG: hypothetical protein ABIO70_27840 [Pseudomonadota bacterium]
MNLRAPSPAAGTARRGLGLVLLLAAATGAARAERMDRVLAVVGDRVVTTWDLLLEEALQGHVACPEAPLCDPARAPLDRLVDRAIIRGLAEDTPTYRPRPEEVQARLAALRETWTDPAGYHETLRSLGLSEEDLTGLLYSRVVAERYIQRQVGLPVLAAGGDAAAYHDRYRAWIEEQRDHVRVRTVEPEP